MIAASSSADRVKDSTTTTGTGNLTLSGTAPTGYQNFNAAFGTNVRFFYAVSSASGAEWEVGQGYLSASTTLVRERILSSSNSNAAVSFSAGTNDVFVTFPSYLAADVTPKGRVFAIASKCAMP